MTAPADLPEPFMPVGDAAEQVVINLASEMDRRRAEILECAANELEAIARGNRALAQELRERAG